MSKNIFSPLAKFGFVPDLTDVLQRLSDLELTAYDVINVDVWDVNEPEHIDSTVWFDTSALYVWLDAQMQWVEIPLSLTKIYVDRSTNYVYTWSGSAMVQVSTPITKAAIEALLIGEIESHTHYNQPPRTVALASYAIDLTTGEDFSKTCGTGSQFTIANPIIKKPFRLILTGGTVTAPLFTGYTVNWIYNSLITDYVPASTNYLICEIRAAGQIYVFWGA